MKTQVLSTLGVALLALAMVPLASAAGEPEIDGKAKFLEYKCLMCHGVAAEGLKAKAKVEKMKGPDLSGFKSEVEFARLASFLRGEIAVDGRKHTKPFKGSDEELQAIIDWLGSLEVQN